MDSCCDDKAEALAILQRRHGRTLRIVLAVNAAMFAIEFGAGLRAGSTALLADSLDMLGDALVYALSLYALARPPQWKARAALAKGGVMAVFGIGVLAEVAVKLLGAAPPEAYTMGIVGALALGANALCFALLWRHRADDVNLRSAWLCSRNDIVANVAVLFAAGAVALSGSFWPDVLVGASIAALFLRTSVVVCREAARELRDHASGAFAAR